MSAFIFVHHMGCMAVLFQVEEGGWEHLHPAGSAGKHQAQQYTAAEDVVLVDTQELHHSKHSASAAPESTDMDPQGNSPTSDQGGPSAYVVPNETSAANVGHLATVASWLACKTTRVAPAVDARRGSP